MDATTNPEGAESRSPRIEQLGPRRRGTARTHWPAPAITAAARSGSARAGVVASAPCSRTTSVIVPATGITIRPGSPSWSTSAWGRAGLPPRRGCGPRGRGRGRRAPRRSASWIPAHGIRAPSRFAAPHRASAGSSSTPTTSPSGPVRWASRAVVQPDPEPTSSTRWPGSHVEQPQHVGDGAWLGVRLPVPDEDRAVVGRRGRAAPGEEAGARHCGEGLAPPGRPRPWLRAKHAGARRQPRRER